MNHTPRPLLLVLIALLPLIGACAARPLAPAPSSMTFRRGAVACDHADASEAGAELLRLGGNAVDAAVGASFALSVVRPHSCGLGGGGFMVIHLIDDPFTPEADDATSVVIDYRESAPGAVGPEHFFDLPEDASRYSGHAVGAPGTVAGLLLAHERFGVLPLRTVLAPAMRLARDGFSPGFNGEGAIDELEAFIEDRNAPGDAWLRSTYIDLDRDEPVRNRAQFALLRDIAQRGADAFYRGDNARHLIDAVRNAGGVMTLEDLASYEPVVSTPLEGEVVLGGETRRVLVMPPPSSGGVAILQTIGMMSIYDAQMRGHVGTGIFDAQHPHAPSYVHAYIECAKHAFADRARHMGDTRFVGVPIDDMLDAERWERAVTILNPHRTLPTERYGVVPAPNAEPIEDAGTSHLSVIDRWGNAVACTETINLVFGSRIAVPELGIVLNNEMDDFLTRVGEGNAFGLVQSRRNLPSPGKRPLSSMSPTIVLNEHGDVVAVVGASGGPRIISGTTQALLNALHFGMPADEAIASARWHHQWRPDAVFLEPSLVGTLGPKLIENGHETRERPDVGVVQLLVRRNGVIEAASDPRKGGAPAGY